MRVVHYARPGQLDTVVPRVLALSRDAEVHLVLETAPEDATSSVFGPIPNGLRPGVHTDVWSQCAAGCQLAWGNGSATCVCTESCTTAHVRSIRGALPSLRGRRGSSGHLHLRSCTSTTRGRARRWRCASWAGGRLYPGCTTSRSIRVRDARVSSSCGVSHGDGCHTWFSIVSSVSSCIANTGGPPRVASTVVPFGVVDVFRAWEPGPPNGVAVGALLWPSFGLQGATRPPSGGTVGGPCGGQYAFHHRRLAHDRVRAVSASTAGQWWAVRGAGALHLEWLTCELFQRATLVVLPYTSATQSGVAMTAFGFGKPVVATRVGGIPEVVEDGRTGYSVPPDNAEKLAKAIITLLSMTLRVRRCKRLFVNGH